MSHLKPVCEWGGCEKTNTRYVEGYLLCPLHEQEHHRVHSPQAQPAAPVMPEGWHSREECDGHRVRERDYLMRLLQQQRQEIDQLITYLEQPRPTSKAEHARAQGELIVREGAAAAGYDLDDILSPRRTKHLSATRQWLMYRCHVEAGMSLADTGRLFDRDHTTVLHAIKTVRSRRAENTQPREGAA